MFPIKNGKESQETPTTTLQVVFLFGDKISKVSKACQNSLLPTQRTSIMEFLLQLCIDFVGVKMHFNATFNEQLFYHNLNELCLNLINHTKQMSDVILKLQITAMAFWQ